MHLDHLLTDPASRPVALILGAVLLVAGRKLFWLFVGIVGFVAGYSFALQYLHLRPGGAQLVVALVAGVIGVLLAIFAQKIAIAIAGFLVGAYLAEEVLGVALAPSAGHALSTIGHLSSGQAIIVLAVGVLAALLAVGLFDLALIVLSALAGAGLVSDALQLGGSLRLVLFVVLACIGMAVQTGWSRRSRGRA